jgi:LAGLIDADG-like domain
LPYRKTNELSQADAAYIAGLIDGEGSIGLLRRHRGDQRQLVISIPNTERQLLEFVLLVAGAGKITRKRVQSEAHTASFAYTISNQQALDLLRQIRPYLRSYKVARAETILTDYLRLTPRNGKYDQATLDARNAFIQHCMKIRANGKATQDS